MKTTTTQKGFHYARTAAMTLPSLGLTVFAAMASIFAASADTYTWVGGAGAWDGSSLNWTNSAGIAVAWENGKDALFPATSGSSSVTVTPSGTPVVNDATFYGKYTLSDPIAVTGKLTSLGTSLTILKCLAGESVRLGGSASSPIYLAKEGTPSLKTLFLEDSVTVIPSGLNALGANPSSPATNIVVQGESPSLIANGNITMGANRIVRIASGSAFCLGAVSAKTLMASGPIVADSSPGLDFSTNTVVTIPSDRPGMVVFSPGANVTNDIGRLEVRRDLKIASGVTRLGSATKTTGDNNGTPLLLVVGNNDSDIGDRGNLVIDGATLYSSQERYVDIRYCGQVVVTNGGKVLMPNVEWLNGFKSSATSLVVANGGVFEVATLRVSDSGVNKTAEVHIDEGGTIRASMLYMYKQSKAIFTFNGGTFQSTRTANGGSGLFGGKAENWPDVSFRIGEKGAIFNASNGIDIKWERPLESGAASDGGLTVLGADRTVGVTFSGAALANSYNGPTVVSNAVIRFAGTCTLTGEWEFKGDSTGCGLLSVAAGQDISGIKLKSASTAMLNPDAAPRFYKILDAPDGYVGRFQLESGFPSDKWSVSYMPTAAYLSPVRATTIVIR